MGVRPFMFGGGGGVLLFFVCDLGLGDRVRTKTTGVYVKKRTSVPTVEKWYSFTTKERGE